MQGTVLVRCACVYQYIRQTVDMSTRPLSYPFGHISQLCQYGTVAKGQLFFGESAGAFTYNNNNNNCTVYLAWQSIIIGTLRTNLSAGIFTSKCTVTAE